MSASTDVARARYVEQALALIDRCGGSRGLNLRELSRSLGFAHTNAYNYFDGLEALLDHAMVEVLERQVAFTKAALQRAGSDPRRQLERLVGAQVDFALAHPGWHQFVWLEPLRNQPPPRAIEVMQEAGDALTQLFGALSEGRLSRAGARAAAEDFHDWLHGALCKQLTGRSRPGSAAEHRKRLMAGARRVLAALVPDEGRAGTCA